MEKIKRLIATDLVQSAYFSEAECKAQRGTRMAYGNSACVRTGITFRFTDSRVNDTRRQVIFLIFFEIGCSLKIDLHVFQRGVNHTLSIQKQNTKSASLMWGFNNNKDGVWDCVFSQVLVEERTTTQWYQSSDLVWTYGKKVVVG